jgi:hypothetical protein
MASQSYRAETGKLYTCDDSLRFSDGEKYSDIGLSIKNSYSGTHKTVFGVMQGATAYGNQLDNSPLNAMAVPKGGVVSFEPTEEVSIWLDANNRAGQVVEIPNYAFGVTLSKRSPSANIIYKGNLEFEQSST